MPGRVLKVASDGPILQGVRRERKEESISGAPECSRYFGGRIPGGTGKIDPKT